MNPQQSSDKVSISTNPKTSQIIKRGRFDITLDTLYTTGYGGSLYIDLGEFDGSFAMPVCEVMIDQSGGGTTSYTKMPFTILNTSLQTTHNGFFSIQYTPAPYPSYNGATLYVFFYRRAAVANETASGTYIVRSESWANPNDPESSY